MIDTARLQEHVSNACAKHPAFCTRLCHKKPQTVKQRLAAYRRLCQIHETAEYILAEECYEIFDAIIDGNLKHAVDECYDAAAVLCRIIAELNLMMEKENAG